MPVLKRFNTATFMGPADIITDLQRDQRLHFPATAQNQRAIWEVLGPLAASAVGPVLEVASGSGEHLAYFRSQNPYIIWQGSDPVDSHRASVRAHNPGLTDPLDLDVTTAWGHEPVWGGVVAINLLHISPWEATIGLMRGAAGALLPGAWLYLYGAYLFRDRPNAASNLAFDRSLREQNSLWGVRRLDEVVNEAALHGLALERLVDMPSNNFSLIFRRSSA